MNQSPVRLACHAFSWFALGLGAVLGLYAAVFASRTPCVGQCAMPAPGLLGWCCVGAAVVVIALLALGRQRAARWAAGLVGLGLLVAAIGGSVFHDAFSVPYVVVPAIQLPLTATAVALTLSGSLILLFAAPGQWRLRSRAVAVGAAVAVVAAATGVGVGVAQVSALRRAIDATTAAPVTVPQLPSALGSQIFRIRAGVQRDSRDAWQSIFAAGASFVMLNDDKQEITGFDPAGKERWHYRHDGLFLISGIQVYGGGTTVLAGLYTERDSSVAVLALDAMTGTVLWVSEDPVLLSAYFDGEHDSPFLVDRRGDQWTAFDPRTGREMWAHANPLPCHLYSALFADTSERIVALDGCGDNGNNRLVTVDPATGAVAGTVPVPTPEAAKPLKDIRIQTAGSTGVAIYFGGTNAGVSRYINATTLVQADFPETLFAHSTGSVGDPLLPNASRGTTVLNSDGTARCTFAPGAGPMDARDLYFYGPKLVAWTPDTITYLTSNEGHPAVRSARRSNCQETAAVGFDLRPAWQVLAVPGATVVLASEAGSNYLIGFGN